MSIILKAKDITLGGILTALTIIMLYLTTLLPINKLALLTIASLMVPIALIKSNIKTAFIVYISSTLLAFLLVPVTIALLYMSLFGIYGIIKYLIEQMNNFYLELIIKFIFFNILLTTVIVLISFFWGPPTFQNLSNTLSTFTPIKLGTGSYIILWCIAQIGFIIYDYALSLLIGYYETYFCKSQK